MTYLDQRKKLFEDKLAYGYLDRELEVEINNLEATMECFRKLKGIEFPPNSCACGGLKIHESDYCKDCV